MNSKASPAHILSPISPPPRPAARVRTSIVAIACGLMLVLNVLVFLYQLRVQILPQSKKHYSAFLPLHRDTRRACIADPPPCRPRARARRQRTWTETGRASSTSRPRSAPYTCRSTTASPTWTSTPPRPAPSGTPTCPSAAATSSSAATRSSSASPCSTRCTVSSACAPCVVYIYILTYGSSD